MDKQQFEWKVSEIKRLRELSLKLPVNDRNRQYLKNLIRGIANAKEDFRVIGASSSSIFNMIESLDINLMESRINKSLEEVNS